VGIDLHPRRSVIVRMSLEGERLSTEKIDNDARALAAAIAPAGPNLKVVVEAPYGWYSLSATGVRRATARNRSSLSTSTMRNAIEHMVGARPAGRIRAGTDEGQAAPSIPSAFIMTQTRSRRSTDSRI